MHESTGCFFVITFNFVNLFSVQITFYSSKLECLSRTMEQHALQIVSNCLNTNIHSYLETSGGQSSNLYLYVVHFFNTNVLIRHLLQLGTVVFLQWCLICAVLVWQAFNFTPIYYTLVPTFLQQTLA
jgi:hypothetical protein